MIEQTELRDDELPAWLAHAYANLKAERDPVAGYKRCAEFAEAFLAWAGLFLLSSAGHDLRIAWLNTLRAKRGGKGGGVAAGDWAGLVRNLAGRRELNKILQLDWKGPRRDNHDPVVAALRELSGAARAQATVEDLFEIFIADRNDFAHRTADSAWCGRIRSFLVPAFEQILRHTFGVMRCDLVYLSEVQARDDGHTAQAHVLRGTVRHRSQTWPVGQEVTGQSVWLFQDRTALVRVPGWLVRYDPATDAIRMFQGWVNESTAVYYATENGADIERVPLSMEDIVDGNWGVVTSPSTMSGWSRSPTVTMETGKSFRTDVKDESPTKLLAPWEGKGKDWESAEVRKGKEAAAAARAALRTPAMLRRIEAAYPLGTKVRYLGSRVPNRRGEVGTVVGYVDGNGLILVYEDGGRGSVTPGKTELVSRGKGEGERE